MGKLQQYRRVVELAFFKQLFVVQKKTDLGGCGTGIDDQQLKYFFHTRPDFRKSLPEFLNLLLLIVFPGRPVKPPALRGFLRVRAGTTIYHYSSWFAVSLHPAFLFPLFLFPGRLILPAERMPHDRH